jgi:hypothetical protein
VALRVLERFVELAELSIVEMLRPYVGVLDVRAPPLGARLEHFEIARVHAREDSRLTTNRPGSRYRLPENAGSATTRMGDGSISRTLARSQLSTQYPPGMKQAAFTLGGSVTPEQGGQLAEHCGKVNPEPSATTSLRLVSCPHAQQSTGFTSQNWSLRQLFSCMRFCTWHCPATHTAWNGPGEGTHGGHGMGYLQIHPCHAGTDATLMASLSVMSGSPQAQQFISTSEQSELCSHAVEIEGGAPHVARALRHSASVPYIEAQSAPSQLQTTGAQSDPVHV